MVFEKKKIRMETLSEYLAEVRQSSGLSLAEVAGKTGIKQVFLESLEQGSFAKLPADVYVCGFLKQLSSMYNLETESLIIQFKKEKSIYGQMHDKKKSGAGRLKNFLGQISITPRILTVVLAVLFVAITLVYIVWQVFSINRMPDLEVFEPKANQVVKSSFVSVKGKTDPGMFVMVNGQSVFVESDGGFETQLSLTSGPKDIVVSAKNKFEKSIAKNITIIGELGPAVLSANTENKVELSLTFSGDVELVYSLDDKEKKQTQFHKGDSKVLSADDKIVISVSDAGATQGVLNGQSLGALGRNGEALSDIPFSSESAETDNQKTK